MNIYRFEKGGSSFLNLHRLKRSKIEGRIFKRVDFLIEKAIARQLYLRDMSFDIPTNLQTEKKNLKQIMKDPILKTKKIRKIAQRIF